MEAMTRDNFSANREDITTAWVKSGNTKAQREENEQYNIYLCAHLLNLVCYQLSEILLELRNRNTKTEVMVPTNS